MEFTILTHGGAPGKPEHRDGPERAAERARDVLSEGGSALDAACAAVVHLEDDPRFNAGTGADLRLDGETIEMDAACMDSGGRIGSVAAVRDVKNPILVARDVVDIPHDLLVGDGALAFARHVGHAYHDPRTREAEVKHAEFVAKMRDAEPAFSEYGWDKATLTHAWNATRPLAEVMGAHDTVGAIVWDGREHAAAVSTGGVIAALPGRVGDTPLPGCGFYAGSEGAIVLTGSGVFIARAVVASRVHEWLREGAAVDEAAERALGLVPEDADVGLLVVRRGASAACSNRKWPWARLEEQGGSA